MAADRNLLLGILAVQMDFISRDQLVAGMNAWILAKHRPLGDILDELRAWSTERRALVEALVDEHLNQHDQDPEKSLRALSSLGTVGQDLALQIPDAGVQATLALVGAGTPAPYDPSATRPFARTDNESESRFRILRPHAKGGLGEVSVALDEELQREVALKEIQQQFADDQLSRSRFVLEAEITGGLEHPGVVPVYGLGKYADGRPFYAMRFIRGNSLKEAIEQYHDPERKRTQDAAARRLELRKLLRRLIDVCNAIEYAHSRGVLHRDLKPGNIMLGKYGETLVVDWGLAKAKGRDDRVDQQSDEATLHPASASGSAPTQLGTAMGTPSFMSPEQAEGRLDQLGPATDVYSLGATLFAILVGKSAFEGNALEVLAKVREGTFTTPHTADHQVPKALSAICVKAMARRPKDRYASCESLAADLERWLADERVLAYAEPVAVRLGRWTRRHRTAVATVFALLATGLVALGINRLLVGVEQQKTLQALEQTRVAKAAAEKSKIAAERNAEQEAIARKQAEENERLSNRNAYFAEIARAQQAWQDGNIAEVFDMLQRVEPKEGEPDYRGFEYYYLWRACNESHRTFRGHVGTVNDVAVSPNGKTVVSAAADQTVLAWDIATGKRTPVIQNATVFADGLSAYVVEFSPNGKALAVGFGNGEIRLLDASKWKPIRTLKAHSRAVRSLAFAPDGSQLASVGMDNRLCLWNLVDISADEISPTVNVALESVPNSVAFSPDGNLLVVGMGSLLGFADSYFQYFDIAKSEFSARQLGHTAGVYGMAFSPDGKLLATASGDWTVRLWDVTIRKPIRVLEGHSGSVNSVAFSTDGTKLASASGDRTIMLWDVATGNRLTTFRAHADSVSAVRFAQDGKTLVTGSTDRTVRLFPVDTRDYISLDRANGSRLTDRVFSIVNRVKLPDEALKRPNLAYSANFTPDHRYLVVGRMALPSNGRVEIWDIAQRKIVREIYGRPGTPTCVSALSPKGKYLAIGEMWTIPMTVGTRNRHARVTTQRFEIRQAWLPRFDDMIWDISCDGATAIAFSPDESTLVIGHSTGGLSFCGIDDKSDNQFVTDGNMIITLAFHPDGRHCFVGSGRGMGWIYDVTTHESIAELPHGEPIIASAFSPDGRTLVTTTSPSQGQKYSSSGIIHLWDFETRKIRRTFTGHTSFIRYVGFTPDGRRLISIAFDGTARIWDSESGRELLSLRTRRPVVAGALSPDGLALAMSLDDGTTQIWSAEQGTASKIAWHEGLAANAQAAEQWDVAIRHLGELIALRPTDGMPRFQRGRAYWELGDRDKANREWQSAKADLSQCDAGTDFDYWLASLYAELNKLELRKEYARVARGYELLCDVSRGLGRSELLLKSLAILGNVRINWLNDHDGALQAYRKAIDVQKKIELSQDWDGTAGLLVIARIRHERAEYGPAEELIREATNAHQEIYGSAVEGHIAMARLYRDSGRLEDSQREYEQALEDAKYVELRPFDRRQNEREFASLLRQMGDAKRAIDVSGPEAPPTNPVEPMKPSDLDSAPGDQSHGLRCWFFADPEFKEQSAERIDPLVDFIWWERAPHPSVSEQKFGARWAGWLRPHSSGVHHLRLVYDGQARLWIDGKPLMQDWNFRYWENHPIEIDLTDEPHFVQIDYFKPFDWAAVMLQWVPPGEHQYVAIPSDRWFLTESAARVSKPTHSSTQKISQEKHGLRAKLFRGCNFEQQVDSRIDPQVHWFWDKDQPSPGMPADYFSIRWNGKLDVPKDGYYQIWLEGDDGFRMYLDGSEHFNSFANGPNYASGSNFLKAGPHDIVVEFREGFGSAWISLRWSLLGEGGFPEQPIPPEAFLLPTDDH